MVVRAAVFVALGLLTACGSPETASPAGGPDVSRVAFLPEQEAYPQALLVGTLGGDVDTGCLWVDGPGEGRLPFLLHEDTAVLDVSAEPPVIRDGDRLLAAFGDAIEMGGGHLGSAPAPGCEDHGQPFTGNGLQQALLGAAPTVTIVDLHRTCGPSDGPALGGRLVVSGVPRQPLVLEVDGPDGTPLARETFPAVAGTTDLLVPVDDPFLATPPEWNVRVSERERVLAQVLVDPRPGSTCG